VLTDALYVLQELEAMRARDKQAAKRGEAAEVAENTTTICKFHRHCLRPPRFICANPVYIK